MSATKLYRFITSRNEDVSINLFLGNSLFVLQGIVRVPSLPPFPILVGILFYDTSVVGVVMGIRGVQPSHFDHSQTRIGRSLAIIYQPSGDQND